MRNKWLKLIGPDFWEHAFLGEGRPADEAGFAALVRHAANRAGLDIADRLDSEGGEQIVDQVLDALEVGTVGMNFPESMHGDAIWIRISRFPGGTAVGWMSSSWGEPRVVFVVPKATYENVNDAATSAIFTAQDGADWSIGEDDEETPDDGIPAKLFGFEELEKAWNRSGGTVVSKPRAK